MKSIMISEDTHKALKIYCANNNLKIGKFLETIILNQINNFEGDKQ